MLLYTTIIIIFTVAFASQSLMSVKSSISDPINNRNYFISFDYYYTNAILEDSDANKKTRKIIDPIPENIAYFVILIFCIIIFLMFGCIMISLFLKYKKLYKFFSIIMLISLIIIVILLHSDIYPIISEYQKLVREGEIELTNEFPNTPVTIINTNKTTTSPGYIITIITLIFTILTVISSFFIL